MHMDQAFEATGRSWVGRMLALFLGVPFGWILCLGAVAALFWNEGRAVRTERTLGEGMASVLTIGPTEINPAATGRLVHVQGHVSTDETLRDPDFDVSAKVLRLKRLVEIYQWRERRERHNDAALSGGRRQRTTYLYDRVWSAELIDSRDFNVRGYDNPMTRSPLLCAEWEAKEFRLGAFTLQKAVRDELRWFTPYGIRVGEPPTNV